MRAGSQGTGSVRLRAPGWRGEGGGGSLCTRKMMTSHQPSVREVERARVRGKETKGDSANTERGQASKGKIDMEEARVAGRQAGKRAVYSPPPAPSTISVAKGDKVVGQKAGPTALPRPQTQLERGLFCTGAPGHGLAAPQHAGQALHALDQPRARAAEQRCVNYVDRRCPHRRQQPPAGQRGNGAEVGEGAQGGAASHAGNNQHVGGKGLHLRRGVRSGSKKMRTP